MCSDPFLDYEGVRHLIEKVQSEIKNSIPVGTVMMWSGTIDKIPIGWALCDGQNGTPDLQGRFVLGASTKYSIGQTGGSETHTITVDEMPAHTHQTSSVSETESNLGGSLFSGGENLIAPSNNVETTSTGGGSPISLMPPYYVLAYIMKLA